jgi:hypothetical protein
MDLTPYIAKLKQDLAVAVDAFGDDGRAVAELLTATLEPAARLALLNALSDAMAEISPDLAPGSVEVRLRGLDPEFVVTAPPAEVSEGPGREDEAEGGDRSAADTGAVSWTGPEPPALPPVPGGEENGATRTSLRLPKPLKLRAEQAAKRQGISLNTWFVRAVASALGSGGGDWRQNNGPEPRADGDGKHMTGWLR